MRSPKFHVFPSYALAWPDVVPGDAVISPDHCLWRLNDFMDRNESTRPVIVKRNPLLVLARIDKVIGAPITSTAPCLSTFVVFSITNGFLVTIMSRTKKQTKFQW